MSAYKGWKAALRYASTESDLATASNVSGIQSVSPSTDRDSEAIYALGQATPIAIADGTIDLSFDVERVKPSSDSEDFLTMLINGDEYYWGIYPEGYETGKLAIIILGKVTSYSLDISVDGTVTESFTITGRSISVTTVS